MMELCIRFASPTVRGIFFVCVFGSRLVGVQVQGYVAAATARSGARGRHHHSALG